MAKPKNTENKNNPTQNENSSLSERERFEKETLGAHQRKLLDKLDKSDGGVLAQHSLGSGKTLSALGAISRLHDRDPKAKAMFVVPASLVSNVHQEIAKHKVPLDKDRLIVTSYDKAVNRAEEHIDQNYSLVVVDEAHKLRNSGTKRAIQIKKILENANKRLFLTGTPVYNQIHDISPMVNSVSGQKILPTDPKEFERDFVRKVTVEPGFVDKYIKGVPPGYRYELKNKKKLKEKVQNYIDFYDATANNKEDFAKRNDIVIPVEMSKTQKQYYKYVEGDIPFVLRMKIRSGIPLDKKEMASLNAFSTGVRQVSNTHAPYVADKEREDLLTTKLQTAVDNLERKHKSNPEFRGVVYSNYLDAGLRQYSRELTKRGIGHALFTGELSAKEKDQLVKDYNDGKNKVLLLSSSGAEGLNLKGTRLMQILEPHFNKSKIDQVIGRGIRYKSHEHLPKEDRVVDVEHYLSINPSGILGPSKEKTIDQYLKTMSDDKDQLKYDFVNMVKTAKVNRILAILEPLMVH